jgi:hypothetical protein
MKFFPNSFPQKSDGRSHLIIVHKVQYVCSDIFLRSESSGVRLPYLQGHLISVDTVFITIKLGYNVMKSTK